MEIFSQRAFDIFRYIFPGLFITIIFLIIKFPEINKPDDIVVVLIDKIELNRIVFLILISYIIGMAHDQLCNILINFFKIKLHAKPEYVSTSNLTNTEKYSLVRHFCPESVKEIDKWHMLKSMCVNISGFLFYFALCCVIKSIIGTNFWQWIAISATSLLSCILIYFKSRIYSAWAMQDLDSTLDTLYLLEKARKESFS